MGALFLLFHNRLQQPSHYCIWGIDSSIRLLLHHIQIRQRVLSARRDPSILSHVHPGKNPGPGLERTWGSRTTLSTKSRNETSRLSKRPSSLHDHELKWWFCWFLRHSVKFCLFVRLFPSFVPSLYILATSPPAAALPYLQTSAFFAFDSEFKGN